MKDSSLLICNGVIVENDNGNDSYKTKSNERSCEIMTTGEKSLLGTLTSGDSLAMVVE